MKKFFALVALTFSWQVVSFAAPSLPQKPQSASTGATVLKQVSVSPDAKSQLFSVGKGVRKKQVAFFSVQVYEAELFVSNPSVFNKAVLDGPPLNALAKMEKASIRLKFLRTLHSDQVRESFSDALKVNQVDPSSAKMNEFFSTVVQTETFAEGKGVSISADLAKGALSYEGPDGKVTSIQGDARFMIELFSIWLGVPADGGLAALQKALLTPIGS